MENINMIKVGIEAYRKYNLPVSDGLKNWCIEHGREDLLGDAPSAESGFSPLPSAHELAKILGVTLPDEFVVESAEEPATEADMDAMINLAIEQMVRDLGVEIPTKESMPGELLSMEEIFEKE